MASKRTRLHVIIASPGGRAGRGGMASLVNNLVEELPAKLPGIQLEVVDTYGHGPLMLMPFRFLHAVATLVARRLSGRVDLIHIHMSHRGSAIRKPILAWVASCLNVPVVMHLHGSRFDTYFRALPRWRQRLLAVMLQRCARVVVIGTPWRDFVVDKVGIAPARVRLVFNGVPPCHDRREVASSGTPTLLMLGELGARKGTPELIAALATPALRGRAWRATLAGGGAVAQFQATLIALGIESRVALPGWQDAAQVRALLQRADVLVLPSHHEGLPMAILEAMAAGVVVISTPVGAIPDAIIDGETGLLVAPGDPEALAAAIVRVLDDGALRRQLVENARARWKSMFTIDGTASAIAMVYRELGIGASS